MERPNPIRHLQTNCVEVKVIKHVEDNRKSRQLQGYDQLEVKVSTKRESDEKISGEPKKMPKH